MRNPQLIAQRAQVLLDQVGAEAVVTGGYGRMRGEDDFAGHLAGGGVEVHTFFLHSVANGLEDYKAAVTFIEMKHAR